MPEPPQRGKKINNGGGGREDRPPTNIQTQNNRSIKNLRTQEGTVGIPSAGGAMNATDGVPKQDQATPKN